MKICVNDSSYVAASPPQSSYGGRRRLMGGGGSYDAILCPADQRQVFSLQVMHDAHYLLFAVAAVHVVYTTTAFATSLQRFKSWRVHEDHARDDDAQQAVDPAEVGRLSLLVSYAKLWTHNRLALRPSSSPFAQRIRIHFGSGAWAGLQLSIK